MRAQLKESDVRGVTILYDQAMDGIMDPVVVAMSSAFAPFGGGTAMPGVKRNVEYATAIVANAAGYLIADRTATEGCHIIVVPGVGNAERVAEDKDAELALLRVYGVGNLKAMALSTQPPRSAELTLIGIGDPQLQNGRNAASTVKARIRGTENGVVALEPAPPSGFSGAAVDRCAGPVRRSCRVEGRVTGLAGLGGGNPEIPGRRESRAVRRRHQHRCRQGVGDARDLHPEVTCFPDRISGRRTGSHFAWKCSIRS